MREIETASKYPATLASANRRNSRFPRQHLEPVAWKERWIWQRAHDLVLRHRREVVSSKRR
jgi:hypothetical protein